ncbi:MAG: hypothetical protein KBT87_14455 [Gammaproteobacteria bacterium]|nr:hypothetical protein [Gammaproteobacteria bacterium]
MNYLSLMRFLTAAVVCMLLSSCMSDEGQVRMPWGYSEVSDDEIKGQQRELKRIESRDDIKDEAESTFIFEGIVTQILFDRDRNLSMAKMEVTKYIYHEEPPQKSITVLTPAGRYGVNFVEGNPYKVLAVDIEGELWTWTWTGTFNIETD